MLSGDFISLDDFMIVSHVGQVYSWGSGQCGQLGLGEGCFVTRRPRKVQVDGHPNGIIAQLISAGMQNRICNEVTRATNNDKTSDILEVCQASI